MKIFTIVLLISFYGVCLQHVFCGDETLTYKDVIFTKKITCNLYNPKTNKFDIETDNPKNFGLFINNDNGRLIISGTFANVSQSKVSSFSVRLRIYNDMVGKIIYNRTVCIDTQSVANPVVSGVRLSDPIGNPVAGSAAVSLNGIPSMYTVKVSFPEFEPNAFIKDHIGNLSAVMFSEPYTCNDKTSIGDEENLNDTLKFNLYTFKEGSGFFDYGISFKDKNNNIIPSPYLWQNTGADVVNSDLLNWQPLNQINYENSIFPDSVHTAIRMNRFNNQMGKEVNGYRGDTLTSNILDVRGKLGTVISFSCQRMGKLNGGNLPRGWADSVLWGPEHRVVYTNDPLKEYRRPDKLVLDIAWADSDNFTMLANVPDSMWNIYPDQSGKLMKGNPGLEIFGGGGSKRSVSIWADTFCFKDDGIIADIYDDGKDEYFKPYCVKIPDYFINKGGFIRFRLRVEAEDNGNEAIKDDYDDFFVDNISVIYPSEINDISVQALNIPLPYYKIPRSQAVKIPLRVVVSNNANINATTFLIILLVKHAKDPVWPEVGTNSPTGSYAKMTQMPYMGPSSFSEVNMPNMDLNQITFAKTSDTNTFDYKVILQMPGGDMELSNDTLTGQFTIITSDEYSYLPYNADKNDVPGYSGIKGKGLNLPGYSDDKGIFESAYGSKYGTGTGEIGMRFQVFQPDTLTGIKAYFGSASGDTSPVRITLYRDEGTMNIDSVCYYTYKQRGYDDERKNYYFDEYTNYLFDKPVRLYTGYYWLAISQPEEKSLELGASAYNSGIIRMNYTDKQQDTNEVNIYVNKKFRKMNSSAVLANNNQFAYRNDTNSLWLSFAPPKGNTGYSYLDSKGMVNGSETFSGGTWVPMLKPVIRGKTLNPNGIADNKQKTLSLNIYPNPADDKAVIQFNLEKIPNYRLSLTDIFGKELKVVSQGEGDPGENYITLSFKDYSTGIYLLRLESEGRMIIKKLIVKH